MKNKELNKAIKRGYSLINRNSKKFDLPIGALETLTDEEFDMYIEKINEYKKRRANEVNKK